MRRLRYPPHAAAGVPIGCLPALALDAFSPLALPGLSLWLRPDRGATTDGAALLVRGSNHYFQVADHPDFDKTAGMTFCAWLFPVTSAAGGAQYLFGKGTTVGNQREFWLAMSSTGPNRLNGRLSSDGTSGGETNFTTTLALTVGTWNFVALRHDPAAVGGELKITLDGSTQAAAHSGGVFNGTASLRVGTSEFSTSASFDGRVDSVAFWTRPLSDTELAAIRNGGAGKTYADLTAAERVGLVSWWDMDEAAGNRADAHDDHHLAPVNPPIAPAVGLPSGPAADEDAVSLLTSQAPPGNFALQPTAVKRPSLETTGTPAGLLSFDGADDALQLDSPFAAADGFSLAWVSNPQAGFGVVLGHSTQSGRKIRHVSATQLEISDGANTRTFTHAAQSGLGVHVVSGGAAGLNHWFGGAASAAAGNSFGSIDLDRIGVTGAATQFFQGDLGHLVAVDRPLALPQINQLGQYLARQYALPWTTAS